MKLPNLASARITDRDGIVDQASVRWASLRLEAGSVLPELGTGFALLWPAEDIRLSHGGRDIAVRAGDLVMVDRALPMTLSGNGAWTARLLYVGSHGPLRVEQAQRGVANVLDGATPLAQILKRTWVMGDDIHEWALKDEPTEGRLLELIGDLARRLLASDLDGDISAHYSAMIERAKMLIAAHRADPDFSAGTLAQRMRVSARHLSSLFAAVGTTPTNAIMEQRLTHARQVLADPACRRRRIASIALDCGFADANYFTRRFTREFGVAPNQFRSSGEQH